MQKFEFQKSLISQSEDKICWATVITKTRHPLHPAQEGSQFDWSDYNRCQAIAETNYQATGELSLDSLGINKVLTEWEESVPIDQPTGQFLIQLQLLPGPPVLFQPQPPVQPPVQPTPGPSQPGPSTGTANRPSPTKLPRTSISWPSSESDDSRDPDY